MRLLLLRSEDRIRFWELPLNSPQDDFMAQIPLYTVDDSEKTVLLLSNRQALIPTLKEFQRRIEFLATYLQGLEQESLALRSAAENIEHVIERLLLLKESYTVANEAAHLMRLND